MVKRQPRAPDPEPKDKLSGEWRRWQIAQIRRAFEGDVAGVTLHALRNTFATRLKDAGVDPFTVRDLLGHATLQMTGRDTHATEDTMRRRVEVLNRPARESARIVPARLRESA